METYWYESIVEGDEGGIEFVRSVLLPFSQGVTKLISFIYFMRSLLDFDWQTFQCMGQTEWVTLKFLAFSMHSLEIQRVIQLFLSFFFTKRKQSCQRILACRIRRGFSAIWNGRWGWWEISFYLVAFISEQDKWSIRWWYCGGGCG